MNSWWKSANEIDADESILQWEQSIQYDPRLRRTFNYLNDIVYSLRGPRQVGKTTLVKLQIRDFLRMGVSPWNIMYYSFDLETSPSDVVDVIRSYQKMTKSQRGTKRSYLFLDEISSVKDWQKGIKWLWDQGYLKNNTVVATGSHTIDIKSSTERLPGRRGITNDPYDKIMLPMKFSEYVPLLDKDLKQVLAEADLLKTKTKHEVFKQLTKSVVDKRLENLMAHLNEFNEYLQKYMATGGTPRIVNEYYRAGTIGEHLYTNYLNSVLGQLSTINKEETFLKQLMGRILKNLSWPVSWRTIQKETDVGSTNTVISYLMTLRDMFVLTIFYQYGEDKKVPRLDKEKRIHFHDPFFFHVMNGWLSAQSSIKCSETFLEDPSNQGMLIEGIVGDHLIRLAFALCEKKQTFDYSNHVF
ncbi:MAG: ATP-binding protein, partial [Nitrososphaerales archaeon]